MRRRIRAIRWLVLIAGAFLALSLLAVVAGHEVAAVLWGVWAVFALLVEAIGLLVGAESRAAQRTARERATASR